MAQTLDDVDRGILHMLQLDARNASAQDIADRVGVSASTVRNRIDAMEERGVIVGYHPHINYELAGFPLRTEFVVTASPEARNQAVEEILGVRGVVDVREMLTASRNLYVEVVGLSSSDLGRITDAIHEMGHKVESSEILRQHRVQAFDHFALGEDID